VFKLTWPLVIVIAALSATGGAWVNGWRWESKYNTLAAKFATEKSDAAGATQAEEHTQRGIENARQTITQREVDYAIRQSDIYRRAADSARAANDRLQNRVTEIVTRARETCGDTGTAGCGASVEGGDALSLLERMLQWHTAELVEVGQYADELRNAGATCEVIYDGVRAAK
jgi:hypothetical protein